MRFSTFGATIISRRATRAFRCRGFAAAAMTPDVRIAAILFAAATPLSPRRCRVLPPRWAFAADVLISPARDAATRHADAFRRRRRFCR